MRVLQAPTETLPELAQFLEPFHVHFLRSEGPAALERYLTGLLTEQPNKNWFIRRKRALGLKEADMLIPLGVAYEDSKPGGQHVHQPVVSRLRHPRLPVHPHRLPGRSGDHHHPPGARDLPLLRLQVAPGPVARPGRAPFPCVAHRPPRHLRGLAHPPRRMPGLWRGAQVEIPFADPRRSYTSSF